MFGSGPAPPINNALLPDIYNRLDAGAIERTRVVNNQLRVRLESQERVFLKYKKQAMRMNIVEQTKVSNDLSRISKKLPTVKKVHNFDAKFFKSRRSHSDPMPRMQKRKGYLEDKNDDSVCQRCYIHHLPLKKKFYRVAPIESPMLFDNASSPMGKRKIPIAPIQPSQPMDVGTEAPRSNDIIDEEEISYSQSPILANRKAGSRLIPVSIKFQFLERDRYGHERDLNAGLTPRLMPNEDWKFVVKNVCSQHRRPPKPPKNDERKAVEDSNANRSRRQSVRTANKSRGGEPRPPSRATSLMSRQSTRTELNSGKQKSSTNGEIHDTQRAARHSRDNTRSGKRTGKPSSSKQSRPNTSEDVGGAVAENSRGGRKDNDGAKTKRPVVTSGRSRRGSSSELPPLNRKLSGSDGVGVLPENGGGGRKDDDGAKSKRPVVTSAKSRRASSSQLPSLNRRLSGMTPPKEHEDHHDEKL